MVGETASLLEPPADPNQSGDLLEQTLVEESPDKSHALDDYDDDDFTGSSGGSTNRGSGKVLYFPVWGNPSCYDCKSFRSKAFTP